VAVNIEMDGSRRLGRQGWRARPMAAAHRSKSLPAHQSTKLDKVFTYGIVAMRGTRFAHLGMAVAGDSEVVRLASGVDVGRLRCFSGEDEGAKGAVVFDDPFRMVDSTQAVAHRRGDKHHTTARVSTIVDQNSP
jgi:hypothetical protein